VKPYPLLILILFVFVLFVGTSPAFALFPPASPTPTPILNVHGSPSPSPSAILGTLKVGVSDSHYTSPPEIYYDKNNKAAGFDIDLITAIAQVMKFQTNITPTPVGNLINGLNNKNFDVVISAFSLTDDIKGKTLNIPYLSPKDVLLTLKENADKLKFDALTDLCGHTIGVQDKTSELADLNNTKCTQGKINVVKLANVDDVANALIKKQNNVEAIYQSTPTASYYQKKNPGKFQQLPKQIAMPQEGILIRQDNKPMFDAIQDAFNKLSQNGKYKQLLNTPMGDMTGDTINP
jgi:polar amino acid transport system substrate-binding protein